MFHTRNFIQDKLSAIGFEIQIDNYGNLIIDLNIIFPETLGDKQKEYLKKILIHFFTF